MIAALTTAPSAGTVRPEFVFVSGNVLNYIHVILSDRLPGNQEERVGVKITATQIAMLRQIVADGGVVTAPSPSASGTYRKIKHLENLGLLVGREQAVWEVTPKGLNVSRIDLDTLSVSPRIEDDGGILVEGQHVSPGDEVLIRGRRGRFRFKSASVTSGGRTVVDTIGPIGMHQAFRNFYLEDVKLIPKLKPKRRRRVV